MSPLAVLLCSHVCVVAGRRRMSFIYWVKTYSAPRGHVWRFCVAVWQADAFSD
jgi:hypothetical protein